MAGSRPVKVAKFKRLSEVMYNKDVPLEKRIADLEAKKVELENRIARMKEIQEVFNTLPFKEGDVAFHPEYGNVLIKDINYGPAESDFNDIKYSVYSMKGQATRSYTEFTAITDATKILFSDKGDERDKVK